MALTANSFLKIISVAISGPEATANTLSRTYTDRIEDPTTIAIYYNGQLIQNASFDVTSKFYYTIARSLGTIDGITGVDSGSTALFTMLPNPAYTAPGYASGTSTDTLSIFDTFTISYYYVVYTAD